MIDYDPALSACPLCGSNRIGAFDHDYLGNRFDLCRGCGLKFMNPRYSDAHLESYYSTYINDKVDVLPQNRGEKGRQANLDMHVYYLSRIEALAGRTGRLLSVGCGAGLELEAARNRNWQVEGYDVDPKTVDEVGQRLSIPVFSGDFLDVTGRESRYDCIYLNQVLEHLKHPTRYLEKIDSLLRSGGLVFIACPNIASLANSLKTFLGRAGFKNRRRGRHYDSYHHLLYFTPRVLKRFLEGRFHYHTLLVRNGYKVRVSSSPLAGWVRHNILETFPWQSTFMIICRKP